MFGWIVSIFFIYLKYKNKEMEIIKKENGTYQLINSSNLEILHEGSFEDCQIVMYAEEDARLQEEFIMMMG